MKKNLAERTIHRARRRSRQRLFADVGLRVGDRINVSYSNGVFFKSQVKDFIWTCSGLRRFILLDNGLFFRVGAPPVIAPSEPSWWKA